MSPHAFGGRARQYQPVTRERPPRAPAATFPVTCVTETFNQADSATLGPDLTWETCCEQAASTGSQGFNNEDSFEVYSNQAAITNHFAITGQLVRSYGYARTVDSLPSNDVLVTATASNVPTGLTAGNVSGLWWGLSARMDTTPMQIIDPTPPHIQSGYPVGIHFMVSLYSDDFDYAFSLQIAGPTLNVDGFAENIVFFNNNVNNGPAVPLVTGDELSLLVVGRPEHGGGMQIVGAINGVPVITANEPQIEGQWGDATVWDEAWPDGGRGGFTLLTQVQNGSGDFNDFDHLVRLDDWSMCGGQETPPSHWSVYNP